MNGKSGLSLKVVFIFVILMLTVTIGSFVAMRVFLGRFSTTASDSSVQTGQKFERHFALIHSGGDDELWGAIYEGALEQGRELGAYVEYFGRDLTEEHTTEELLGMAIDARVDGVIIDGSSSEQMTELINRATETGIPVVTVFSDCAESDRICFVGFSSYTIGRQYGAEIVRYYDDRPLTVYLVMDSSSLGSSQDLVAAGIADEFADHGLADACVIEGVYINDETAFTAEEDIRDIFVGQTLPDAMVALNDVYTRCLFQAAVDHNKVGAVYLYGFNDSADILEAVGKGLLEATISVDTGNMGAGAVTALNEYLDTGYVSNYLAQDTVVMRPEDVWNMHNGEAERNE